MARNGTPMLFAPPRPPVMVPRRKAVVIGRSPDADLIVNSRKASRRHAEVRYDGELVIIEDLESTNGTVVNGEEITGSRVLEPGDHIEIGGVPLHYCFVDDQAGTPSAEEDTTVFEGDMLRQVLLEALRGDLSEIPLSSVLNMLEEGRKSGTLGIVTRHGSHRLWLEDGRPVHAETPTREGFDAAMEICHLEEGRFVFDGCKPVTKRTIDISVIEVLLEASRRRDESRNRDAAPPKPAPVEAPAGNESDSDLFRDWWKKI